MEYDKNARQPGGTKARCYINRRLAHRYDPSAKSKQGEVVRMWKKNRLFKAACFLAGTVILMYLSTINAC